MFILSVSIPSLTTLHASSVVAFPISLIIYVILSLSSLLFHPSVPPLGPILLPGLPAFLLAPFSYFSPPFYFFFHLLFLSDLLDLGGSLVFSLRVFVLFTTFFDTVLSFSLQKR